MEDTTLIRKFMNGLEMVTESGCWLWVRACTGDGYGAIWLGRSSEKKQELAHRFSYEHFIGPIPPGLQIDHLCRVRCCVNPYHLEPVTGSVNSSRGHNLGREKTHCPQGHEYTGSNTYYARIKNAIRDRVGRKCKACHRDRERVRKANIRKIFASAFKISAVAPLFVMASCSSGLQERAFKDESGVYIVTRSLVNDRVTANQPHISGVFACDSKVPVEAMAQWRQLHPGEERSEYSQCQPVEKYRPGAYQVTSDQPVGTIYKGAVESAVLGAAVGTGLALSGPEVTQQGGGASANASATARGSRGHRR